MATEYHHGVTRTPGVVHTHRKECMHQPEEALRPTQRPSGYAKYPGVGYPFTSCERAVSTYISKFVVVPRPRGPDGAPVVIAGTIDWVYAQRGEPPDCDRAVTFAEFVDSIVKNSDADLDTHFKSQQSYLSGQHFDELFAVEEIERLKTVLESKFGQPAEMEHANRRKQRSILLRRPRWDMRRMMQKSRLVNRSETGRG